MNNKKIFSILIIIPYMYFYSIYISFGYTGKYEKIETIRDLKNNLNELNNKNTSLNKQINQTIKNAGELKFFFRDNLTDIELKEIKEIFVLYTIYSDRINKEFNNKIKNLKNSDESKQNLLKEKAGVYKRLTPYIKTEKLKEFLEFIKSDLIATKEKKEIEEGLYIKNYTLTKKVALIKEKIVEHKKALDKKLEKLIIKKVNEKIIKLKENPNFKSLSYELKKEALNNIVLKINNKVLLLKESPSNLNDKKKELYNIIISKLEDLNNSLTK